MKHPPRAACGGCSRGGVGAFLLRRACSGKPAASQAPPAEVLVTDVKQEDVPILYEFVSTLDGSVNASIQARAQGYLTYQNYKEGTAVKKGDLLFQIDPHPLKAALARAQAALAQNEASQRQAELTATRNLDLSVAAASRVWNGRVPLPA
ncbi:MAG: biotin/lipoyl-binding protein, partial [Chthoniobacterales bacterium]|nr:biotin/lipoyl-binding protein [Chthoniobacterales bacterium]